MGVHFAFVVVLIAISYITAQEYVIFDESDLNPWDIDDQSAISEDKIISFLCENYHLTVNDERIECESIQIIPKAVPEENEHVIQKREAPETELEGSGNGESANNTSVRLENWVEIPEEVKPVADPQATKDESEQNSINKTSIKPETDVVAPPETKSVGEPQERKNGESEPKIASNNTSIKPEDDVQPLEVQPVAERHETKNEETDQNLDNRTSNKPETDGVAPPKTKSVGEPQETKNEESEPTTASNNTSIKLENDAVAPQEAKPVAETEATDNEKVPVQISNSLEKNPAAHVDEAPKSETETEVKQPKVENEEVQHTENKTDLPSRSNQVPVIVPNHKIDSEDDSNSENQGSVPDIKEIKQTANDTIKPTSKLDIVNTEKPILPPLIHSISNESTPQKSESTLSTKPSSSQPTITSVSKTDSPKAVEKEGGIVANVSDSEKKESGIEEKPKTSPKVLPSDLAEVESIHNNKESEPVNEKQSGNAVLLKTPTSAVAVASNVEGSESEKILQGMQENAKITNETKETAATGESAKNVSRAGKDTTILVVLFVVVIAIGGAAFTHNFIKKRKQNASRDSQLVNGIRRSLQNLTSDNGKNNTDVEQGTEMKPLMKNNAPTLTKEYTDTKKEVPA